MKARTTVRTVRLAVRCARGHAMPSSSISARPRIISTPQSLLVNAQVSRLTLAPTVEWRRRRSYTLWRNTLALASLLAFGVYQRWPLAPPRLAGGPDGGPLLVDTLASHPSLWSFESPLIQRAADPLAAMPSMHVGWAVVCAWAVAVNVGAAALGFRRVTIISPAVVFGLSFSGAMVWPVVSLPR